MSKHLTPAQRLFVAGDFKPTGTNGRAWVESSVLGLADMLEGTGVGLKVNSGQRALDYNLIGKIRERNLKVFADLKLSDIPETLATDGVLLREAKPDVVTVMCSAGSESLRALKNELPDTIVLGITVLTTIRQDEASRMFRYPTILENVLNFARIAMEAGLDGIVCAPKEAPAVRSCIGPEMTIITPGVRPAGVVIPGDDQNPDRVMTPAKAIAAGADYIVVGRPILNAASRSDATMLTIGEIASATA